MDQPVRRRGRRYDGERDEDPLVRSVRRRAQGFESGLILTLYGKVLRWGPGWWLQQPSGPSDEQQAIPAQLRGIDGVRKPYYSGMAGPGERDSDVRYHHKDNHNRFNSADGDQMERLPGTRTYGEARLMEQRVAEANETIIGKAGDNYRGNRQNPLAASKLEEYEKYEAKLAGGC
jgi:hypothetical protein